MQNLDHHFVINKAPSLGLIKGRLFHGLHYVSLLRFEFPHGKLKLRTVCRMLENETYNVTIKAKSSLTISRRNMYHKVES